MIDFLAVNPYLLRTTGLVLDLRDREMIPKCIKEPTTAGARPLYPWQFSACAGDARDRNLVLQVAQDAQKGPASQAIVAQL